MSVKPKNNQKHLIVTMEEVFDSAQYAAKWCKSNGIQYITPVPRGGLIFAALMQYFDKKLTIVPYDEILTTAPHEIRCYHNDFSLNSAILVDDIVDTGTTYQEIISQCGPYKMLAMFCRFGSTLTPAFYSRRVQDEWVVFPWEKFTKEFDRG